MRREPKSTSVALIDADGRRRESVRGSRMQGRPQVTARGTHPFCPQVVDDFPEAVPVTQGELDVIETYLGSLLDDMLKRMH